MTPHERALEAVKQYLLPGDTVEVTSRSDWGFAELGISQMVVERFLSDWRKPVNNVLLHILAGEGVEMDKVLAVVQKACRVGTRVLVLEHNPDSKDFHGDNNVKTGKINDIQRTVFVDGYWGEWVKFDKRNMLFVVTTIKHVDESLWSISQPELVDALNFQYENGLPEKDRNIFCQSSEKQPNSDRLLSEYTADVLDTIPADKSLYMVVGGMMFLDLLAETKTERDIVLLDLSLPQLLYAMMVVEIIKEEPDNAWFEGVLMGAMPRANLSKVGTFVDTDLLLQWLRDSENYIPRPDKDMTWRNIVKIGHWRQNYRNVRKRLLSDRIWYHWGGLDSIKPSRGDVVYTSTLSRERWEQLCDRCMVIEACSERNVPMFAEEVAV